MKKFPFTFEGRELNLRKLDQDAKEDLLDRMVAGRLKQAHRMSKKGYLTPELFLDAKQGAYIKWGTEAFVTELVEEANAKAFIRALLVENAEVLKMSVADFDDLISRLVIEQRSLDSDFANAVTRMREDDDPKATTPPDCPSTPTGGDRSSSTLKSAT